MAEELEGLSLQLTLTVEENDSVEPDETQLPEAKEENK